MKGRIGVAGSRGLAAAAITVAGIAVVANAGDAARSARRPPPPPPPTLLAVGDIHACSGGANSAATAKRAAAQRGTVAVLGDEVDDGSYSQFASCYARTWGRVKSRTRPTPGNHEYDTPAAAGYFQYFGSRARTPGKGWYSYKLGTWHVVVLNSNCSQVGGCDIGSAQLAWLQHDLATHKKRCTLAYFHHPLFTSTPPPTGNDASPLPLWQALYAARVELVLNAHSRDYERFAPQTPDGRVSQARGIREFVVGTGGGSADYKPPTFAANSRVWNDSFGVLKLTLRTGGYSWRFLPVPGRRFADKGSASCH